MQKVYCDADVFIGWFNEEDDKVKACRGLVDASEKGEVQIITSAIDINGGYQDQRQATIASEQGRDYQGVF